MRVFTVQTWEILKLMSLDWYCPNVHKVKRPEGILRDTDNIPLCTVKELNEQLLMNAHFWRGCEDWLQIEDLSKYAFIEMELSNSSVFKIQVTSPSSKPYTVHACKSLHRANVVAVYELVRSSNTYKVIPRVTFDVATLTKEVDLNRC